jgi:beta-lactamase regulating signal transducer with metallopeptidase domain
MSDRLTDLLLWPMLDVSIRWGLLIVGLAGWFAIRPPRRAATRHTLCVAALLAGPALLLAPRWDAYVHGVPPKAAPVPAPVPDFSRLRPLTSVQVEAIDARVAVESRSRPSAPVAPIDWGDVAAKSAVAAWLIGTLLMLARLALGARALRRWAGRATAATADDRALLDACREARPIPRRVRLMRHPEAVSPVVVVGFRPAIMLPPDWDAWPVDRRRAAMLHELAHARRYDDASKLLEELLRAPTWFHPAVAWLLARLDRERELLCDEAAVAAGDDPKGLARLLLDLSRSPAPRRLPSVSLPFLTRRTTAVRIRRLLEDDMPRTLSRPSLARAVILGSTALAALLALGAARVRPASAQDAPAPQRPYVDVVAAVETAPAGRLMVDIGEDEPPAPAPAAAPAPIKGVVVDADGKPIAGATVVVVGDAEFGRRVLTADAEGKFSTPGPIEEGLVHVRAAAPGWVPGWGGQEIDPLTGRASLAPLVIKLARAAPFAATLVDEDDRPLVGATVRVGWITYDEPTPWVEDSRTRTTAVAFPRELEGTPIERHFTATTGEDGSFSLPDAVRAGVAIRVEITTREGRPRIVSHPPPGRHGSTPEQEGFLVPKPGEALRVKTLPAARIEGKVTTRVPGVDVSKLRAWNQRSRPNDDDPPLSSNSWREVPVDADGRFAFDGLEPGTVNVFVSGEGAAESWTYRAVKDLKLVPGRTSAATIELIEGVEVSGLVATKEGDRPIAGATVAVHGPFRPRTGGATDEHPTDADGRYRFRLPSGETYLYIMTLPEGYPRATGQPEGHRTVMIPEGVARFEVPTLRASTDRSRGSEAVKKAAPGR